VKVALALYKQASEMGVAPAAMNAGLIYDRHPDLRNAKSAEYYYELAGEYGMPEGITNLALMKAKLGTATASEVTAMLIRASDEGDEYASNMLAQALGKRSRGSPHW
jgi:TPR repeat protein